MKHLTTTIKKRNRTLAIVKDLLIIISISAIATFIFISLTSSTLPEKNTIPVQRSSFVLKGDSIFVSMEIRLDSISIDSKSYILLTPVVHSGKQSKELPAIQINGKNRQKIEKRLASLNKGNKAASMVINISKENVPVVYKTIFPYEPWMENAGLILREDRCGCAGETTVASSEPLADKPTNRNIVYQPKLNATFVAPEAEAVKQRSETGKAYLDFPLNESIIYPDFRNNAAELQRMYDLINLVKNDPNATINGITITGYASPEGLYTTNMELSGSRARALAGHLKKTYGFKDELFKVESKGEDWQTLEQLVAQSDMDEKEQVLAIIRSTDIFDGREKKLMDLAGGAPYYSMLKTIFPKLRRSEYELNYTVLPFTVEKGKEVMKTRPSGLSLNELFLIANTYEPGSDAFNEVFETAARIFPQSDVANLNAAANALNRKDTLSAEKYLSKITQHNAAYWNNAGVLAGLKGDYEKAAEYFEKACAAGNAEASNNTKEIEKTKD